jgi:hypothetical protein
MRCSHARWTVFLAVIMAIGLGCDRARTHELEDPALSPAVAPTSPIASLSETLSRPAPPRLVAIGDLHGDLDHTRRALRLAGAIDAKDQWVGGSLVIVQTGDEVDRGDDDRAILDSVEKWKQQAKAAGGEFIALLGNHELMNATSDFRYVTPEGFASFASFRSADAAATPSLIDPRQGGRAVAFSPGGDYARLLGRRPIFIKVGATIFVHGGILPKHVRYGLDKMDNEVDAWLLGQRREPPNVVMAEDGPVWTRKYSAGEEVAACSSLAQVLSELGAKRMVVGHTVQAHGISSACGDQVWRIDVGLSHAFGGPIEVLQIEGDSPKVLREP